MLKLCPGVTSNSLSLNSLVESSIRVSKNQTSHVGHRFDRCPQLHSRTALVTETLSLGSSAMVREDRVMVTESIHLSTYFCSCKDLDEKVHRKTHPNSVDRIRYHRRATSFRRTVLCISGTHQLMQNKQIVLLNKKEQQLVRSVVEQINS